MSSRRVDASDSRSAVGADGQREDGDVNVRPMRLKILYTFDEPSKTNCLARWPHILDVQTVAIDEGTCIGVVDLQTCVQAIIQCSPELVATLGQDYTVYAYDYSECDTPLVGQGMLSWALASGAATPNETSSRQLVTGRVCKNIMGIFSQGVKETLEVKLRLLPMPTVQQSDFLQSLEKYRDLSKVIPTDFDHKEWTAFLESNPSLTQPSHKPRPSTIGRRGSSFEVVNQLLSPSLQPHDSTDIFNGGSVPGSRPGTPGDDTHPSRPSSRASQKRGRKPRTKSMGAGEASGNDDATDEDQPAARKRAKIVQANWNSKSSFGAASDSLRVTASTAGSLRNFRPIAPAVGPSGSHLQEVPRAPTPVPFSQSNSSQELRRASLVLNNQAPRRYRSPYVARDAADEPAEIRLSIESAVTSPERASPSDTPPDINSSPPVMRTADSIASSPGAAPSSPMLPAMPHMDSGFFSGAIEDCSVNDLFEEDENSRDEDLPMLSQRSSHAQAETDDKKAARQRPTPQLNPGTIIEETPGPPELLPKKILPRLNRKPRIETKSRPRSGLGNTDGTESEAASPQGNLPYEMEAPEPRAQFQPLKARKHRTGSVSSAGLPAVPAGDPALPSGLHRSHTWSETPHPQTDAPDPSMPGFSRTTASKKQAIRQRLEDAIARGETPPYCKNCGAIETPTWRKAWAQELKGEPGYHEYSDEPGRVTAIDILKRDDDGKPSLYRLIKKSLRSDENKDEFMPLLLCNPCGIWMSKYNRRRPAEKWDMDKKRGRTQKHKNTKQATINPTSEAYIPSDAPAPQENEKTISNQAPAQFASRQRASSARPTQRSGSERSLPLSRLTRDVQSSPIRWAGSQDSPIDLDAHLGTTRRLLFPSPRKEGEVKVLGPVATNVTLLDAEVRNPKADTSKENSKPGEEVDHEILQLFEEEIARPTTPTPQTPDANQFKTPTRNPTTPYQRPLTRSQSRSIKSAQKIMMLVQQTPSRTPSKTPSRTPGSIARRRSPRNHPGSTTSSPFTALSHILTRPHDSPSQNLDYSTLPPLDHSMPFNFSFDPEDFFSTDVPMPSSPPRLLSFGDETSHVDMTHFWANMDLSMDGTADLDFGPLGDVFKPTDASPKAGDATMRPPKKIPHDGTGNDGQAALS